MSTLTILLTATSGLAGLAIGRYTSLTTLRAARAERQRTADIAAHASTWWRRRLTTIRGRMLVRDLPPVRDPYAALAALEPCPVQPATTTGWPKPLSPRIHEYGGLPDTPLWTQTTAITATVLGPAAETVQPPNVAPTHDRWVTWDSGRWLLAALVLLAITATRLARWATHTTHRLLATHRPDSAYVWLATRERHPTLVGGTHRRPTDVDAVRRDRIGASR